MFHRGRLLGRSHNSKKMNKVKKFESLTAFSTWLEETSVSGYFADNNIENSKNGTKKFTQTESFEEADGLMLGGWADGAKDIRAYMDKNALKTTVKRAETYGSVVGFAPSVGRYLAGVPKNMMARKTMEKPSKVVTILYNISIAAGVPAENIKKTSAKLLNVLLGLEKDGFKSNVWIILSSKAGAEYCGFAVKIKSAGQVYNVLKMSYPLAHPSFLRRHGLAAIERVGVDPNNNNWLCYGTPVIAPGEIKKVFSGLLPTGCILSYYDISGKSEDQIKAMIK